MNKIEDIGSGFGVNDKPELKQENNIDKEESIDEFEDRLKALRDEVSNRAE